MLTAEQLKKANEQLKTVDIKGKKYAQVSERIKAFREVCPGGQILTDIVDNTDGVVTMKATIFDEEGKRLASGYAQEKETSSFINKTSYIENCETSAVGRALGFVGIGVDGSFASAEEVSNAILNQTIADKDKKVLENMVTSKGYKVEEIFPGGLDITNAQYVEAVKKLEKMKAKA
jgi:hypothetical protein